MADVKKLWTWGSGANGRLGLGNTTDYSSPKQVGALTDWASVSTSYGSSTGNADTAAVKTDGTLWTWGSGAAGRLGHGNTTAYSSPKQVGALTNWASVSTGGPHTAAVKTDGTLWTWGRGVYGRLGLGNTTDYSSPKQVGTLTDWASSVSASYQHTAAVKTDGTLWTWGRGTLGRLGHGNTTGYSSPKQVGALTDWASSVSAGYQHTAAVKTDGTLWTWGEGGNGRLGLGNVTDYSSPKQVGALTNWSSVSSGTFHTAAVKTDGTLWTWGTGNYGRLGHGNTTTYSSPKQVGALTDWASVSAGWRHTAAVKTDGTLWTWGQAGSGQLGLGNTTGYSSPKQVGALTNWSSVSTGGPHMVAITLDAAAASATPSRIMRLFEGFTVKFVSGRIIIHQKQ